MRITAETPVYETVIKQSSTWNGQKIKMLFHVCSIIVLTLIIKGHVTSRQSCGRRHTHAFKIKPLSEGFEMFVFCDTRQVIIQCWYAIHSKCPLFGTVHIELSLGCIYLPIILTNFWKRVCVLFSMCMFYETVFTCDVVHSYLCVFSRAPLSCASQWNLSRTSDTRNPASRFIVPQ